MSGSQADVPELQKPSLENAELTATKKREKKVTIPPKRDGGKSLLPFSRVQKIIKADKDIPIMAKDAIFLVSLAAEEFIKRLSEASQVIANCENRATVQERDVATVVRKADEFLFLEEIIPWTTAPPPARRKPKALETIKSAPTLLDQYVVGLKSDSVRNLEKDIVMNEDGTMYG